MILDIGIIQLRRRAKTMFRTFVEIEGRAPKRHEIPKPCDHFDLIVGTGTGGLIALMLGRLRLDLEKCEFNKIETEFLGSIIRPGEVAMDPHKVKAIIDW